MAQGLAFDPIAEASRHWTAHGWPKATPGMALVTSVMRVHQILLGRVEAVLRPLGLTFARYEVLMLLTFSRRGELPLGTIGRRLQVHPASVTNAIDRLEEDRLVRRRAHPSDGRRMLAGITAKGRRLALAATAELNDAVFERLELDERELRQAFELLRAIRIGAGDFDGSS